MRWPWSKKDADPGLVIFEVPVGALARKTIYDSMITTPEEIAEKIGFPPIGEDVAEMEREASILRLKRIDPLVGIISVQSRIVAEAAAEFQRSLTDAPYSEEAFDAVVTAYTAVAFSAACSVISNLLDLDILHKAGD